MTDSLARAGTGEVGNDAAKDLETRLARAEERLAFYASFDRVIQDNVAQAGQLMRDALDLRERTQAELAEARAAAEARVAAERTRYRDDLAAVHAELVGLQATTAAMARRVAATLGELAAAEVSLGSLAALGGTTSSGALDSASATLTPIEAGTMAGVEPAESEAAVEAAAADAEGGSTASTESGGVAEFGAGSGNVPSAPRPVPGGAAVGDADEAEVVDELTTADAEGREAEAGSVTDDGRADEAAAAVETEMAALGAGTERAAIEEAEGEWVVGGSDAREVGGPEHGSASFPVAGDASATGVGTDAGDDDRMARGAAQAPAVSRAVMVLVHGVPRAAAALSLQRHLHGLRQVESVEAREYAEGVLRLQVMTGETLGLDDLRGWEGGGGLEPVTVTAEVIEVRLPGAQGF